MFNMLYRFHFFIIQNKKIDAIYLKIINRVCNLILPIYFKLSILNKSFYLPKNNLRLNRNLIIVSLTSFPARINKVWLTIETILRQKEKPDIILLWLYKGEFNGKESLPNSLLRLEKRGLEIRFCDENLMPHKKYFYTMKEFPDASVITLDDDMFYPLDLVEKLLKYNKLYPKSIICPITRKISIDGNNIKPYKNWAKMYENSEPSFQIHTMGGGGTLFPPNSLHPEVFDLAKLKDFAIKADDLWLKIMSLRHCTQVVSIAGEYPRYFMAIRIANNLKLMDSNIHDGQNDLIFQKLINHYQIKDMLINSMVEND